jgi:hypothetical protein
MDAAKKEGPRSSSKLCMMYGINVKSGACRADAALAAYPINSTANGQ